ncbi:MAG: transglycosylase SLT domain-containing protein [Paraglaciecola sp.]|nr:transglycosylase SLT domain-containing protein [Paraglaciecola sp.]NCT49450.1 transglycosylase SLT domain-containing protein [Paraglaciecola sp.]
MKITSSILLCCGVFLCLVAVPVIARSGTTSGNGPKNPSSSLLEQQRGWYVQAERLADNPKNRSFQKLLTQLDGYPLTPYLQQAYLVQYPFLSNREAIEQFLDDYQDSPLDRPLRKKWLEYLGKKNQADAFMQAYRDVGDAALACKYAEFGLADEKQKYAALAAIGELWVVGDSQPKACDNVFRIWQKAGLRTPEKVWQRLTLAADGGNHTLIPYLKTLLPDSQKYLADLWLQVRRSPSQVSRLSIFPNKFPDYERQIMVYGLNRLVWNDRDLALRSWQKLSSQFNFTDQEQQQIAEKFALALVIINHPQAEQWLERAASQNQDEELLRWHLAHVLRQQDWKHALDVIEFAPANLSQDYVFQYWQARALEEVNAPEQAKQGFELLADQRHYYGFLASGKLAKKTNLNDTPLHYTQSELDSIASLPAAQRALEFRRLERPVSARREWMFLQSQLNEQQLKIAAVVADQHGWHDQAIFTFSKAGYLDDLSRRFPMAFDETLKTSAQKQNIDPAWAFAIVRRESSFMPDASSGAGAMGLMQVLPSTARYLVKQKFTTSTLYDPKTNVELGTQYMRYLLDKMDNNPILATASYNAGWRRVRNWLPEKTSMPMDLWVETIPYKETRNYVKAVLAYQQIYREQLGDNDNQFTALAKMRIAPKG